MEVILISNFSAIIILITVISMNKVFLIAYQRNELSLRKYILLAIVSVVIGSFIALALPFGYDILFQAMHLLANVFFVMAVYVNKKEEIKEIPFISKSYDVKS